MTLTALFCYGSNHTEQVRRRLNNPSLISYKCELPCYKRIFAGKVNSWQTGGVASIINTGNVDISCKGSYVLLTDKEFNKMDRYEGIFSNDPYDKNPYVNAYYREQVTIKTENNVFVNAIAYIKTNNNWQTYPSNEYLQSCYKNIKPFWPDLDGDNSIQVYDNKGQLRGRYVQ